MSTFPEARIETLAQKKLVGQSISMSLVNNQTGALWAKSIPLLKKVTNAVSSNKHSMQVYPEDYYKPFNPNNTFTKWACVEVSDFDKVPEGLHTFLLEGGLYAVFEYVGRSTDTSIYQYIFSEWLPKSGYVLDNRPHFEVLGAKYKNDDPSSEEEIWIPIFKKTLP
ncbi:MAG: GyrI-like domain-containing protein [Bacteroidota bacterium]